MESARDREREKKRRNGARGREEEKEGKRGRIDESRAASMEEHGSMEGRDRGRADRSGGG